MCPRRNSASSRKDSLTWTCMIPSDKQTCMARPLRPPAVGNDARWLCLHVLHPCFRIWPFVLEPAGRQDLRPSSPAKRPTGKLRREQLP